MNWYRGILEAVPTLGPPETWEAHETGRTRNRQRSDVSRPSSLEGWHGSSGHLLRRDSDVAAFRGLRFGKSDPTSSHLGSGEYRRGARSHPSSRLSQVSVVRQWIANGTRNRNHRLPPSRLYRGEERATDTRSHPRRRSHAGRTHQKPSPETPGSASPDT